MSNFISRGIKKLNKSINKTLVGKVLNLDPVFTMFSKAIAAGNWDKPFGSEASALDYLGAGPGAQITSKGKPILGQLDPDDPKDRAVGRTVGTLIADYWTFGLASTLVPKPKAPAAPGDSTMNLENTGDKLAFNSLTSPGVTSTGSFTSDASSVTPAQAQLAMSMDEIKKWAWYGVAIAALFFILSRKGILR